MRKKVVIASAFALLLTACAAGAPPANRAKHVVAQSGEALSPVSAPTPAPNEDHTQTAAPPPPPTSPSPSPETDAIQLPKEFIRYENQVIVLMYHHIAEQEAGEEITITPDRFHKHMQAIKDNHYQVIPMETYIDFVKRKKAIPPNAVVITFDDGYESYYKFAYPELKSRGFTSTNFIVLSYVGSDNPKLPFMNWTQVKEMHRDGFSFYSHTYDLHQKRPNEKGDKVPALANKIYLEQEKRIETEDEYRKRIRDDLNKANDMLEAELGNQRKVLCFPYGAYNRTVMQVGNEIGIEYFFTTKEGVNNRENKEVLRINAGTRYVSAEGLIARMSKFNQTVKQ